VTAYARYFEANAILQGDRDIGFCAAVDFGGATCLGSNFGPFPTTLTLPVVFESDAAGDPVQFLANTNADGALQFVDAMGNFIEDIEDAEGNVITPAFLQAVPLLGNMPMFFDDETGEPLSLPRQLPGSAAGTVSLDENGNFMLSALGQGLGATNAFNFNPLNFFQRHQPATMRASWVAIRSTTKLRHILTSASPRTERMRRSHHPQRSERSRKSTVITRS